MAAGRYKFRELRLGGTVSVTPSEDEGAIQYKMVGTDVWGKGESQDDTNWTLCSLEDFVDSLLEEAVYLKIKSLRDAL